MSNGKGVFREFLLLSVVVLLFAGNIIVGEAAADALPPFTLALARALIALTVAVICFGRGAWRNASAFRNRKRVLFTIGASDIGLFNALLYASLHSTDPVSVAVLEASIPIFTALVMWLGFGEHLGGVGWIGIMLSTIGAMIVVSDDAPWAIVGRASWGDVVMLGAVAAWIIYAVTARRGLAGLPRLATMVPLSAAGAAVLLPLAIVEQVVFGARPEFSLEAIASAFYLGLGPSLVAFIIYNRAVVTIGPTPAALSLNGLPVAVMILSFLFFGKPVTAAHVIGTLAVIAGVTGVILKPRSH